MESRALKSFFLGSGGLFPVYLTMQLTQYLQSGKNIHPAVSIQQHAAEPDVLSRDDNAYHEARYRVCAAALLLSLPPDKTLPLARSFRSKYGIVLRTLPSSHLACPWRSSRRSYSLLTSV